MRVQLLLILLCILASCQRLRNSGPLGELNASVSSVNYDFRILGADKTYLTWDEVRRRGYIRIVRDDDFCFATHAPEPTALYLSHDEGARAPLSCRNCFVDPTGIVTRDLALGGPGDYAQITWHADAQTHVYRARAPLSVAACAKGPTPEVSPRPVDFRTVVFPVLAKSCIGCHSTESQYPIFKDRETIRAWTPMMKRVLREGRMPGGSIGHQIELEDTPQAGELRIIGDWLSSTPELSDAEMALIDRLNGSLRSAEKNHLQELGASDFTVKPPVDEVVKPGTGSYVRIYKFPYSLAAAADVKALNLAANLNVVHHVSIHILEQDISDQSITHIEDGIMTAGKLLMADSTDREIRASIRGKDIPGKSYDVSGIQYIRRKGLLSLHQKQRYLAMPRKGFVYLEAHFFPTAKAESAGLRLELFFDREHRAKSAKKKHLKQLILTPASQSFSLAPHEANVVVQVRATLKKDYELSGYSLHTHYRGVSGRLYLLRGSERVDLVNVPLNQMKLQRYYTFREPVRAPAGSVLVSEITYDNSAANQANPDPNRRISFGLGITDAENHLPRIYHLQ